MRMDRHYCDAIEETLSKYRKYAVESRTTRADIRTCLPTQIIDDIEDPQSKYKCTI